MLHALRHHWPEYLIEGLLLGLFMVSACVSVAAVEHPASPIRRRITSALARRTIVGILMGLTAILLIYSPLGQRSGAHMNPCTTLTFAVLGKVAPWDAVFYVAAQFIGGLLGVVVSGVALGTRVIRHESVAYVVTLPGPRGRGVAWAGEFAIAFGMMSMVLLASNNAQIAPYTGLLAGLLLVVYIAVEAPLSGMSLNPARTIASAVPARNFRALWVYLTAPALGMLLAAGVHAIVIGDGRVYCAKLNHGGHERCIFNCRFDQMPRATRIERNGIQDARSP